MRIPPPLALLRRLLVHINPKRRTQVGFLFLVMILASFAEVISIGAVLPFLAALVDPDKTFQYSMVQPLIQMLSLTEPSQLLLPITILFSIGALLAGLMRLTLLVVTLRLSHAIGADLGVSIYQGTLYQPYSVHVVRNSSEVVAGITTKVDNIVNQIVMPCLNILSSIIMLTFVLLALITIDPLLATCTFAGFGAIYGIVILSTQKMLLRNSQNVNQKVNQLYKVLQEGLGGIRDVLIDCNQAMHTNIYRNADLPLRRGLANIKIISNSPRFGIEALGIMLIAVIAYSLSGNSTKFSDSLPVLGALALGAQRLLPMLQLTYSSWSGFRGGQFSLFETLDLLDQPLPAYANGELPSPIPFKETITLNNIEFKYNEDTPLILKDGLSLSILKGSRVGIIGSTGSGKSTLLDIIMGLLRPNKGSLEVDGVSIIEENHQAWLKHIAHVPQAIFLADTSISENIAFGVAPEEIDHTRIRQVAQNAQLSETIESWREQYNTVVGERGVRLSGGQRQRIAIARALYKKADVIVFDEATSALDNDTECAVMEAIENLDDDITLIVVAHRLSTLKNCSQIVELKDGRIERIGSYQQIVE